MGDWIRRAPILLSITVANPVTGWQAPIVSPIGGLQLAPRDLDGAFKGGPSPLRFKEPDWSPSVLDSDGQFVHNLSHLASEVVTPSTPTTGAWHVKRSQI